MDHGIHSTGSQPHAWFEAQNNVFKNNICGTYVSGQLGCRIVGNRFVMGLRNVALTDPSEANWFGYHRGIFSHQTFKFNIQRNVLERDAAPTATQPTEGIVIGYDENYNDVVRSNRAVNLNRGFVGEGINCSTTGAASIIGLQFKCNENETVNVNIWSRPDASVAPLLQQTHSIRTLQGDPSSLADNKLDPWTFGTASTDAFRVTNPLIPVKYVHRNSAPYVPTDFSLPNVALLWTVNPAPANTCPTIGEPPFGIAPQDPAVSALELENEKLAYGNVRYQYDQLIDGGNTDEVVGEITGTWPEDFLQLRTYLLSKSPYLSVEALMSAMKKEGFPDAIRAEICIANPEATQKEGFLKWLQEDCEPPLPGYLLESIQASWNTQTYRSTLEAQLAHHHERYSQAAVEWSEHYMLDSTGVPTDSLLRIWQEVRTPSARYAEASIYLERGEYAAARAVVNGMPQEHELKERDAQAQARLLAWVDFLEGVQTIGRVPETDLTETELGALEALIGDEQDQSAVWISNFICFHYERCRVVHSGGEAGEEKSAAHHDSIETKDRSMANSLTLVPNPATSWISISYETNDATGAGYIEVLDIMGRRAHQQRLSGNKGQVVWDCHAVPAGTYTFRFFSGTGEQLAVERAMVKP